MTSRCQHVLVEAEKAGEYWLCALSYGLAKQACCRAVALCAGAIRITRGSAVNDHGPWYRQVGWAPFLHCRVIAGRVNAWLPVELMQSLADACLFCFQQL